MIPVDNQMVEVDTLPGEEIVFTIGDPGAVMRNLADLYSNKELAVIREYSTNARDSEIEAGNPKPIEVSLPNLLSPYFVVTDKGTGMSLVDMKETYTKFGTSTRTESNDYTGALGFGSKSALAYTNTFTITAVKDSLKTVGVVTRRPDDKIVLKIVSVKKTSDTNGVTIRVPVSNHEKFARIAEDFYRFWEPGTVLVDGKEPERAVGDKITDNLYYSAKPGTSYVVMGSVPYRIANPDALFNNAKMNKVSFVAYVENGAVEFTPSREDLKYSDHTNKTLAKIIEKFEVEMLQQAKDEITKATSAYEAWTKWVNWGETLGAKLFEKLEYDGNEFVKEFEIDGTIWTPNRDRYDSHKRTTWATGLTRYSNKYSRRPENPTYPIDNMHNTFIVKNLDIQVSTSVKQKTEWYIEFKGLAQPKRYVFTASDFSSPWVSPERVINWADIKAEYKKAQPTKPKTEREARKPRTFDYYNATQWVRAGEIPDKCNLYYVTMDEDKRGSGFSQALKHIDPDGIVVVLAINRINKFCRDNPAAKSFVEFVKGKVVPDRDGLQLLTADEIVHLKLGATTKRIVEGYDVDKFDDPEFKRLKDVASLQIEDSKHKINRLLDDIAGTRLTTYYLPETNDDWLERKYPLLYRLHYSRYGRIDKAEEDVYIYVNAKYAHEGKK